MIPQGPLRRECGPGVGGTSLTEGESEIQQWSGYNQSYNFAEDRHTLN
jgi:hypothetical protein